MSIEFVLTCFEYSRLETYIPVKKWASTPPVLDSLVLEGTMYWILPTCNADKESTTEDTVVTTEEDTAEVTDTGEVQDTQEDTSVEDSGEIEEPPPPPQIVRFVAMGDGGEGNETQYKVADVLKTVCDEKRTTMTVASLFCILGTTFTMLVSTMF